jgi:NAD-dependent dihydropyrimidine dehydrogenase PreA subunit
LLQIEGGRAGKLNEAAKGRQANIHEQNSSWVESKKRLLVHMTKYRVLVNRDKCIDCGISTGRCPIHAQLLARELKPNSSHTSEKCLTMGIFSENLNYVKKLVERCPEKALFIERIEQT